MGAARKKVGPYRWKDFVALDEDDLRELIDGELVEVEVPIGKHELLVVRLGSFLDLHARKRGGVAFGSGFKVRISDTRGVMPDLQYFKKGNVPDLDADGLVHGRPDLAVEILSKSSRRFDRMIKLGYYASIGVPEYWLVDHWAKTVERLTWSKAGYVLAAIHEGEGILRTPALPGLRIPLAEVWPPETTPRKKRRAG
jgi:Uma2 family endonuclease